MKNDKPPSGNFRSYVVRNRKFLDSAQYLKKSAYNREKVVQENAQIRKNVLSRTPVSGLSAVEYIDEVSSSYGGVLENSGIQSVPNPIGLAPAFKISPGSQITDDVLQENGILPYRNLDHENYVSFYDVIYLSERDVIPDVVFSDFISRAPADLKDRYLVYRDMKQMGYLAQDGLLYGMPFDLIYYEVPSDKELYDINQLPQHIIGSKSDGGSRGFVSPLSFGSISVVSPNVVHDYSELITDIHLADKYDMRSIGAYVDGDEVKYFQLYNLNLNSRKRTKIYFGGGEDKE